MDVLDVADDLGASKFTELVEKAGLTKMLQDLTNFTLFLPTNEAFKKLPEGTLEDLKEDPESLAELLKYHLTKPDISCRDELTKYSSLTSLDQDNNKIHINSYKHSNFFLDNKFTYTAQCVPLSQKGHSTCGGDVHVVEKVLMPPRGDLLDILSMDKDFGTFVKMAKISGVAEMLQGESEYTIFAPTNEAFEQMDRETFERLLDDPVSLKALLNKHIIKGSLCCAGITSKGSPSWPWSHVFHKTHTTLAGTQLSLSRHRDDSIHVSHGRVTQCDILSTNGIIHKVNKMFDMASQRNGRRRHRPITDLWRWDLDWDKELNLDWNWDT